jgi:hypothetical protein
MTFAPLFVASKSLVLTLILRGYFFSARSLFLKGFQISDSKFQVPILLTINFLEFEI